MSQLAMRTLLEHVGCQVILAEDGGSAVSRWREFKPDVILMDMQLPVINGLEATRQIRQIEASETQGRVTIIAMTANDSRADRLACLDAGMDEFLSKPVTTEQIVRTLAAVKKTDG